MDNVFDPQSQQNDPSSKAAAALERLARVVRSTLWEEAARAGLSPIQIQILIHLETHAHLRPSIGELAAEFDLTDATVSDAVAALERKGLVARKRAEPDRRVVRVHLTAAGRRAARRVGRWADVVRDAVGALPDDLRHSGVRFLLELIAELERRGVIRVTRMCKTCLYFRERGPNGFYCKLLERPLSASELRLDCPDHVAAGATGGSREG